ncbi:Exodeoxyribonuclease VII, small subunit [Desulfonema limicola]|uniref:Exodeoxyribonuclease 7 small subunit n=1 Tax=Desulfonema limicola TaxID=45656 RepID=A0A975GGK9_9BACT|nr:exodeoxyribonuclease VII small subunit [Desulfonema limicola]QTA80426.1 Exodeoxyribonuclease VII, small subunit [Desulfonema limicola]
MAVKQTFEKAMKQLEDIVHELESGDLSLENAMKKFEEGIQLSKFCSKKLDETEKKITMLTCDQDGNISEVKGIVESL